VTISILLNFPLPFERRMKCTLDLVAVSLVDFPFDVARTPLSSEPDFFRTAARSDFDFPFSVLSWQPARTNTKQSGDKTLKYLFTRKPFY
jgi:hypothetical protein